MLSWSFFVHAEADGETAVPAVGVTTGAVAVGGSLAVALTSARPVAADGFRVPGIDTGGTEAPCAPRLSAVCAVETLPFTLGVTAVASTPVRPMAPIRLLLTCPGRLQGPLVHGLYDAVGV